MFPETDPQNLLESEFAEPYNTWKANPSPENATALLKTVHPVLTAALRTYGTQSSPTLQSRAKIMALDAMDRYDPSKAKLRTHLMFQLQGLRRHAAREQQILSVPEQVALDLNHLRESENHLRDQLGRDPSDSELADHTGLSLKRIGYIRGARPSYAEGSMQRTTSEGEDIYSPPVVERDNVRQWHEFVYHDLAPTDQLIMEHTLGLHGKPVLANKDLAQKLMISPGAVSQRKAKIQAKLDLREEFGVI
jgi:DNA-directed RNA polymerase specialized sigma subunit